MNINEEKWSIQEQQPPQFPPFSHYSHLSMASQMSGIPSENFISNYYDGQPPQIPVHEGNHQMYMNPPKQEMDVPQRPYQGYVNASVPRPNGTNPNNTPSTPSSVPDRKRIDGHPPPFTTSSFPSTPYNSATRKRRSDTLGFPGDAGPFFSATKQHFNLYSMDRANSYKLHINSKVDRGFFLADSDWTCYRRNYFQISSAFSITLNGTTHPLNESEVPCLIEVEGQFHTVTQFLLGITARVSNSDKKIELVQHTPKRDKGPQMVPIPKTIRAGGNLNLSSVGSNSNIVTFERIQFKTATANNGKRRAAQQYYVVLVDLYAQVESGETHRVATSTSAALVVRGRSPGHYADNHERYNPMGMNPAFPNDRHIGFHNPPNNGAPGVMPGEYGGSPFTPYGSYPQFTSFPPVNNPNPMRNEALSLIMSSTPNTPTTPFHSQHSHQPYMVPNINDASESSNPDMYHNPNIDHSSHDQKIQHIPPHHQHHQNQVGMEMHNVEANSAHNSAFSSYESRHLPTGANSNNSSSAKQFMKIQIPQSSSDIPDHPLTSPGFHSQEYVEGFQMYNGHIPNNSSHHHGGYHSDNEQHHSNGYQRNSRGSPNLPATGRSDSVSGPTSSQSNGHHSSTSPNSSDHKNGSSNPTGSNGRLDHHGSKSPPSNSSSTNSTPTSELGKSLGHLNMNFRMGKLEESEKL
ncbi:11133_t:CDS:2 [Ambispora leptoticha]|uniref:11133_t:CDS:1 n=1 Tax=Ambispora leptoticha TaxID=144679 RepID=A0A9N9FX83_9GLOM|nr:11133_t:CDS:2 [Ambispora leptoticha]